MFVVIDFSELLLLNCLGLIQISISVSLVLTMYRLGNGGLSCNIQRLDCIVFMRQGNLKHIRDN